MPGDLLAPSGNSLEPALCEYMTMRVPPFPERGRGPPGALVGKYTAVMAVRRLLLSLNLSATRAWPSIWLSPTLCHDHDACHRITAPVRLAWRAD
jgi:hypothetical protein